jgi:hypothetical protein
MVLGILDILFGLTYIIGGSSILAIAYLDMYKPFYNRHKEYIDIMLNHAAIFIMLGLFWWLNGIILLAYV